MAKRKRNGPTQVLAQAPQMHLWRAREVRVRIEHVA